MLSLDSTCIDAMVVNRVQIRHSETQAIMTLQRCRVVTIDWHTREGVPALFTADWWCTSRPWTRRSSYQTRGVVIRCLFLTHGRIYRRDSLAQEMRKRSSLRRWCENLQRTPLLCRYFHWRRWKALNHVYCSHCISGVRCCALTWLRYDLRRWRQSRVGSGCCQSLRH